MATRERFFEFRKNNQFFDPPITSSSILTDGVNFHGVALIGNTSFHLSSGQNDASNDEDDGDGFLNDIPF
jgi:hypothetical protein